MGSKLASHVELSIRHRDDEEWIKTNGDVHMQEAEYIIKNWYGIMKMHETFQKKIERIAGHNRDVINNAGSGIGKIIEELDIEIPDEMKLKGNSEWFKFWK